MNQIVTTTGLKHLSDGTTSITQQVQQVDGYQWEALHNLEVYMETFGLVKGSAGRTLAIYRSILAGDPEAVKDWSTPAMLETEGDTDDNGNPVPWFNT